ncbi:MAG: hypothetical protein RBR37_13200 [Advenella sp.]|nr:hypothetical protein [Advenella sp.]
MATAAFPVAVADPYGSPPLPVQFSFEIAVENHDPVPPPIPVAAHASGVAIVRVKAATPVKAAPPTMLLMLVDLLLFLAISETAT